MRERGEGVTGWESGGQRLYQQNGEHSEFTMRPMRLSLRL